ncbi:DUF6796 family protein [Haploplasma axanthum]|uniref:Uncharacterized protein n=1 Tax=Haploplasma axanthum TaxID=29552 RepID=A0A449BDF9_HAPAX|nr:DUF6796 family protein [Haploplasma axanthum]VEU80462.1 Uncharacterised protein [Haploplasma axanthum]
MCFTYGIMGIVGGLLIIIASIILETKKNYRFKVSSILYFIGFPLCYLGLNGMSNQLSFKNSDFGQLFLYISLFGVFGTFLGYIINIIDKTNVNIEVNKSLDSFKYPVIIGNVLLFVVTSLMIIYGRFMDYLRLPYYLLLFTPIVLIAIAYLIKKYVKKSFLNNILLITQGISLSIMSLMIIINIYS